MVPDPTDSTLHPLLDLVDLAEFPLVDLLPLDSAAAIFDRLYYDDAEAYIEADNVVFNLDLIFDQLIELRLPGIDAIALLLGAANGDWTTITTHMVIGVAPSIALLNVPVSLRVDASLLVPMQKVIETDGRVSYVPDRGRSYIQVELATISLMIDHGGKVVFTDSLHAQLPQPVQIADTGIIIESAELALDLAGDDKCLALRWTTANLNDVLEPLAPNFADQSTPGETTITLRVILGNPIKEIRLDWESAGNQRTFVLPGIKVTIPNGRFSVLLTAHDQDVLNRLSFVLTLPGDAQLTASSNFAWERDEERELQNDDERPADKPPLFVLTLTTRGLEPESELSLLLFELALDEVKMPTFFRQLATPLASLNLEDTAALSVPSDLAYGPIRKDNWGVDFDLNLAESPFTLPFLKQNKDQPDESTQFIEIHTPTFPEEPIDFEQQVIRFAVDVTVTIGPLRLDTGCDFAFNWETFALKVSHDDGLALYSDAPELPKNGSNEHLGLLWRLSGAEETVNGRTRYKYFTLATKNNNYQIQQAAGATLELAFTKASQEPIIFRISDFALGPQGLNLTAEVADQPVRLNGLETRFRFTNSRLVIHENRINDFTLAGSGALPPALVGNATADIALQFKRQDDGGLTLAAGSARLQGNKLLHCEGTRFQFTVDGLGLKFVNDGKFHLYFTLTGSAQFMPAPTDDLDGPLALLGKIKIDLVDCPLAGDVRAIAKHVKFLIELPQPKSFNFLGCFEMELRAIGFLPSADEFNGDGAMELTGQLKFAQGPGDDPDPRADYHRLLIGLPAPGTFLPRIYFKRLAVNLSVGAAFRLQGMVEFIDEPNQTGLLGEGLLQIQGLPTIAASFGFLRVRRDENSRWLRAWFIYLEVRQISYLVPYIQIYIREVGLGFGYRFTIASIKAADQTNDVRELIKQLQALSRTQGDLSRVDRWALDLEEPGQDPRWTIVLRAMFSQTSAASSPLSFDPAAEASIACTFLFDAVIAFRSDLTFFMVGRVWLNTNYVDYVNNAGGIREKPLLSGYVLLAPRRKRFLAHAANTPGAMPGIHPPLPDMVRRAIANSRFSATLLIEPGLLHQELGWPNMLSWKDTIGPLSAEFQGGFIFRVSTTELVLGTSFLARASLKIEGGLDLGIVGVRVTAVAKLAFGARYIGVVDFADPTGQSALYGGIGVEAQIQFAIELWLKIKLLIKTIKLKYRFSLTIGFTAGLEAGIMGLNTPGLRGTGTISFAAMGHHLQVSIKVGVNEDAVKQALARTEPFLRVGLEATEVEPVPGTAGVQPTVSGVLAITAEERALRQARMAPLLGMGALPDEGPFRVPGYSIFVIRRPVDGWVYFVLLPNGERQWIGKDGACYILPENGFLPPPPAGDGVEHDFEVRTPASGAQADLQHFNPINAVWENGEVDQDRHVFRWRVSWNAAIIPADDVTERAIDPQSGQTSAPRSTPPVILRQYLAYAFLLQPDSTPEAPRPMSDPEPLLFDAGKADNPRARRPITDPRVEHPSDNSFEAAVRGAFEQFRGSPFFKRDPNQLYEQLLASAFDNETTIYGSGGSIKTPAREDELTADQANQQVHQLRGMIIHDLVADLRDYVQSPDDFDTGGSIAFQMGLVFRFRSADNQLPAWLDQIVAPEAGATIRQRSDPGASAPDERTQPVQTFNVATTDFSRFPPQFQRVHQYTDASMIALTWDLTWDHAPASNSSAAQSDPDHHLAHYHVRRRALDGREREVIYTVKPGHVLHRQSGAVPSAPGAADQEPPEDLFWRLRPRFQIVDHFVDETVDDLAALPAEGRSYLYTITPFDFAGNAGRPLTLVATRYPNQPPIVPADGELTVKYWLDATDLNRIDDTVVPPVIPPRQVFVTWSEPLAETAGSAVLIGAYRLIFRREVTLPIGSYGLDSATQRAPGKLLPTSNARPLPTDVKIDLQPFGPRSNRAAVISIDELQRQGVLPRGSWRTEAWRVFFQTISVNGVPSALAPVQLRLVVEATRADALAEATPEMVEHLQPEREERRPAELEWLPRPVQLPVLPPEDQRAQPGAAHVPMPRATNLQLTGTLDTMIHFRLHPGGIRAIQFRWNQGPSSHPGYPLALNAGFRLLELDIDASSTATFASATQLAAALRNLQDIQMLPGEDLLLTPGDTLNPSQWEAWYPGTILRLRSRRVPGSELVRGPWYSWQESYLEWPHWDGLTVPAGRRSAELHPFLEQIIKRLQPDYSKPSQPGGYNVLRQISPPIQPNDLAGFLKSCAPEGDPYGWGILQRFGLSIALTLRDRQTSEVIHGDTLIQVISETIAGLTASGTMYEQLRPHVHVELLFQPGSSIRMEAGTPRPDDLLGMVQISLRPTVRQHLRYGAVALDGPPGATVDLLFHLSPGTPCSMINQADLSSGQVELSPGEQPIKRTIRLPLDGKTSILLRAATLPVVEAVVTLQQEPAQPDSIAALSDLLTYDPSSRQLIARRVMRADEREQLRAALSEQDQAAADRLFALRGQAPFAVTDERSLYFTVPVELLAKRLALLEGDALGVQWLRFKQYAESLNSNDPRVPATERIVVPTNEPDLLTVLPDILAWTGRFFEASGGLLADDTSGQAATQAGPWVASAYPRAGSPAYAAPDADGRLTYFHRVEDRWAHTYRYYFQPYGRYDQLWHTLSQSPVLSLAPDTVGAVAPQVEIDPADGGLDMVLDRTQPVDRPLVLSSTRLDEPTTPANPAAPGRIWEVIIAQHPEQLLIERNQTLARQLAFRQIAFTLLRRFAYADWLSQLQQLLPETPLAIQVVENQFPPVPESYPERPDHLALDGALNDEVVRSLALPERIGAFQQGALALQWEALPFYYEHRLLLIAQTSGTVSPINQVTQRDFTYRSPLPHARLGTQDTTWLPSPPYASVEGGSITLRSRVVRIPLCRFWDSLPEDAQQHWPAEQPAPSNSQEVGRKLSSLPDREVIYQIVERFSGNVEVQAEFFYDRTARCFVQRQLGQRFLVQLIGLDTPVAPQGDFLLSATIQQVTEEQLAGSYTPAALSDPTRGKVAFKEGRLFSFVGVMTGSDHTQLVQAIEQASDVSDDDKAKDRAAIRRIYESWFCQEALSHLPDTLPPALNDTVTFPEPTECVLVWEGPITPDEATALQQLGGDAPFQAALQNIVARAANASPESFTVASAPLGLDQLPVELKPEAGAQPRIAFTIDPATNSYTDLIWTSLLFDDEIQVLQRWAQIPEFAMAIAALVKTLDEVELPHTLPPENQRPTQADVPLALRSLLTIEPTRMTWRGLPAGTTQASILRDRVNGLQALGQRGDPPFQEAIRAISAEFAGQPLDTPLTISRNLPAENRRPTQTDVPQQIRAKLTIEPTRVTWQGLPAGTTQATILRDRVDSLQALGQRGDPAFQEAIQAISAAFAGQPLDTPLAISRNLPAENRRPTQTDVPQQIRAKLTIEPTRVTWHGQPASDAELALLRDLGQRGDQPFRAAIAAIIAGFAGKPPQDVVTIVQNLPPENQRPTEPPPVLRDLLTIDPTQVRWQGLPAGTDQATALQEQINDLQNLSVRGDQPFRAAIAAIIAGFAGKPLEDVVTIVQNLPPENRRPTEPPPVLRGLLTIDPTQVRWQGLPAGNDQSNALQERINDLQDLSSRGDAPFQAAIQALSADFSGKPLDTPLVIIKDLPLENRRPTAADVPPVLAEHLTIAPTQVRWIGRPANAEPMDALRSLRQRGDPPFQTAIQAIITALVERVTTIPLNLPVRPLSEELPDTLRNRLLIGRACIRYHGLMSEDEGRALQALFAAHPDRQAIERLFAAALKCGLRGRALLIRARRGNAPPSMLKDLDPETLKERQ